MKQTKRAQTYLNFILAAYRCTLYHTLPIIFFSSTELDGISDYNVKSLCVAIFVPLMLALSEWNIKELETTAR